MKDCIAHHWYIESAYRNKQRGICLICGVERDFPSLHDLLESIDQRVAMNTNLDVIDYSRRGGLVAQARKRLTGIKI